MRLITFKYIDYILRFYLSFSLLIYAVAKVFNTQFGDHYTSYLNVKIVELSGQDLVWVFYGYSKGYEIILGVLQLVALLFLSIDKTKVLGILLFWPIFINILLIDWFYKVTALSSIVYYTLLLTILTIMNYQTIKRSVRSLLHHNFDKSIFLYSFKNIIIVALGIAVLTYVSLCF